LNLLDCVYGVGGVLLAPLWAKKARGGWRERFGHVPAGAVAARSGTPRVVVHGVSVGEINAIATLVPLLLERGLEVVVTAGTDTGLKKAREVFGSVATVLRYPLDFSSSVKRFLDSVRPDVLVLAELELWPNMVRECTRRGVPVAVVNGRLSERSLKGYRKIKWAIGRDFASLAFAAVQDEAYRARFIAMGARADTCVVTGNMKWDSVKGATDQLREQAAGLRAAMEVRAGELLVVGGSTSDGEEALLHRACEMASAKAGVPIGLLCAPRRPERFDVAAAALPGCVRRSIVSAGGQRAAVTQVPGRYVLDSIGELRAAYLMADIVVLGRSFDGVLYGSDPSEAAGLGKPSVIGPRYGDFVSMVEPLADEGGLRVCRSVEAEALGTLLAELAGLGQVRAAMGAAASECVARHRGVSVQNAAMIFEILGRVAGSEAT